MPASGPRMFITMRSVVVLPAPFGPSRPKMLSRGTASDRSFTATWPAKALRIPFARARPLQSPGDVQFLRQGRRKCSASRPRSPAAGEPLPIELELVLGAVSTAHRGEARGLLLVALSTLAYGVQPIFGKVAYAAGVTPLALLAWRYLIALVCLELFDRSPRPPLATRLRLWAIGSVFAVNSIAYFMALEALPASVNALLLYSYPVIVALLAALAGIEALTWRSLIAALAAFAGCALTAGGLRLSSGLPARGVAWALVAAAVYATFVVLSSRFGGGVPARALALHLVQVSLLLTAVWRCSGRGCRCRATLARSSRSRRWRSSRLWPR